MNVSTRQLVKSKFIRIKKQKVKVNSYIYIQSNLYRATRLQQYKLTDVKTSKSSIIIWGHGSAFAFSSKFLYNYLNNTSYND